MVRKIKERDTKIKERRERKSMKLQLEKRNKKVLEKSIFVYIYNHLNDFINKSSIKTFKNYLKDFKDSTNWTLVSDYSFCNKNDKNNLKKSNVYSYVLFPHFIDNNFIDEVSKNIKKDIKKVKKIPSETINALKNTSFFAFNFITEEDYLDNIFKKNKGDLISHKKDLEILINSIKIFCKDPSVKDLSIKTYKNLSSKLERNSFKSDIFQKISLNSFFAAFISILLEKEIKIKNFSWISDRDKMFSYIKKLPEVMYYFRREEMREIEKTKPEEIKQIFYSIPESEKPFYDPLISFPDYFAGTLAEYKIDDLDSFHKNDKEKYKQMVENVFKNNENFVNIVLKNKFLEIYRLMISDKNNIMPDSIDNK